MRKLLAGSVGVLALLLTGCQGVVVKPSTIEQGLVLAGSKGAEYGLKEWSKTKPDSAKECATALKTNINGTLLPYFNGAALPVSAEVQALLSSSLFKNVADEVKQVIVVAGVALDTLLPAPSASNYLTPEQVGYVKAFLTGITNGCAAFLSTAPKAARPSTSWIH